MAFTALYDACVLFPAPVRDLLDAFGSDRSIPGALERIAHSRGMDPRCPQQSA